MKIKTFTIFAILMLFACQASATMIWINSIDVVPSQPLDTDSITFNVLVYTSQSSGWVDHEQFSQNGTSLQLDLYVDYGGLPEEIYWEYSKLIQPLPQENYTLQVRAFDYDLGTLKDTRTVDFAVVPEPTTLAFLGLGLPIFKAFLRRKI